MNAQTKTSLYLGRNIPTGPNRTVSDSTLERFLEQDVSQFFRGFTVLEGIGYWKGEPERVAVLVIVHGNTTEENEDIESIRREYVDQFYQESTLREDSSVSVDIG